MFGHFFYPKLLPCLVISFIRGCSHIWSFILWEVAPIVSLFFYGRLLPCLAISSVGGCSHLRPFVMWEAAPTHLLDPTGIVSQVRLLPADHSRTSVMGAFCLNPLYDPRIMRFADSI